MRKNVDASLPWALFLFVAKCEMDNAMDSALNVAGSEETRVASGGGLCSFEE